MELESLNGESLKVRWLQDVELEVVNSYDEETDTTDTEDQIFRKDEITEFDVFDVREDTQTINVQFGNGSVVYGLPVKLFTIVQDKE